MGHAYDEYLVLALKPGTTQTPLFWSETREQKVFGPDILQETEKQVCTIR
jgi:hypothetical protein